MNKAQWTLIVTFAASFYSVGTIWMTQFGWRLWPYVAPGDFATYHQAWWTMIKPVIFPVAAVALLGSIALIWWRPEGVKAILVWLNIGVHILMIALTIAFWGRLQAQTHFARLQDGTLDPTYALVMNTHWIRGVLITANGLLVLWMMLEHLSSKVRAAVA